MLEVKVFKLVKEEMHYCGIRCPSYRITKQFKEKSKALQTSLDMLVSAYCCSLLCRVNGIDYLTAVMFLKLFIY